MDPQVADFRNLMMSSSSKGTSSLKFSWRSFSRFWSHFIQQNGREYI